MRLARYHGGGVVRIEDEPCPTLPTGGLLVRTEASALCSGELMEWYMDRKVPHVLGHEAAGQIVESDHPRYPVGARVFAHHHAPCMTCDHCRSGRYVHCHQWKRTKLIPGGMSEYFAVPPSNLTDSFLVDDLRPIDAALVEPVGCVVKSLRKANVGPEDKCAVIGLGFMGVVHMLLLPPGSVGFDHSIARIKWSLRLGLTAQTPSEDDHFDVVIVCPGSKEALDFAIKIAAPEARIVLFAPMAPGMPTPLDLNGLYFQDISLHNSYSCGPDDTLEAAGIMRAGRVQAEQVISHFISLEDLVGAYCQMKRGEILKPMVLFT